MPLSTEAITAAVGHMNEDHSDAVLAYARVYGGQTQAVAAEMLTLTSHYMELVVDQHQGLRIYFDAPINSREESHLKLVELGRLTRTEAPPKLKIETFALKS